MTCIPTGMSCTRLSAPIRMTTGSTHPEQRCSSSRWRSHRGVLSFSWDNCLSDLSQSSCARQAPAQTSHCPTRMTAHHDAAAIATMSSAALGASNLSSFESGRTTACTTFRLGCMSWPFFRINGHTPRQSPESCHNSPVSQPLIEIRTSQSHCHLGPDSAGRPRSPAEECDQSFQDRLRRGRSLA